MFKTILFMKEIEQPKAEHPMQEVWDHAPFDPPQGGSVMAHPVQVHRGEYGPELMKRLLGEYGPELMKRLLGISPVSRVDDLLIGKDQR